MLEKNIHESIMVQILKEVYSQTLFSSFLGFKGGTAAYLFYDLSRFSVDLDFDLLENNKDDFILDGISKIIKNFGQLKEKYNKKNTLFFLLSYAPEAHNIKIEISKRIKPRIDYEIKNYLGISMLVIKRENMFAYKLLALLDRKKPANRDIFDVWFFLKNNWPINEEIIKTASSMELKNYLKKCFEFIKDVNEKHILAGMGELLDNKTKIWTKMHLKKDLLFLLQVYLKNLE